MNRLHLEVQHAVVDGRSRRTTRLWQDHSAKPVEIFYEFDRIIPFAANTPLDGHVLAALLYAASLGKPLVVHGIVTRAGLRNMRELLMAWSCWKPERYERIDIIPDRVQDLRRAATEDYAIAAFSGGVDATFTALRNAPVVQTAPDAAGYPLRSLLMVHGFDVDVYNFDDFEKLTRRVAPLVNALQLDLRVVRTNSRELKIQDWDDSSGLELAACLHMHAGEFQYGLIGSTKPYESLVLPWGSNPVTDHLMSGDQFRIIHDGAGYSRTDKVAEILRYPLACQTLKVCWAGADQSTNCGRCEKCVRTRLNFLAAGAIGTPECFTDPLDVDDIRSIEINNTAQAVEFTSLLASAAEKNITGSWIPFVEDRLRTWRPAEPAFMIRETLGGPVKRAIARTLAFLGFEEPAKKAWRYLRRGTLKTATHLADFNRREIPAQDQNSTRAWPGFPIPPQPGTPPATDA